MIHLGYHCNRLNHIEERILANELKWGEFYHYPADDLSALKQEVIAHGISVSIHAPLVRPEWYPNPPTWSFLCYAEKEQRELSLRMIAGCMETAEDFEAHHVVVHFPCPSDPPDMAYEEVREIALDSCYHLSLLSDKHHIPIHMEGFGPSPLLDPGFIREVVVLFPNLSYCFDTGHLHIAALRDGFDLYLFAQEIAPYVHSIHLWNNRGMDDYINFRHIPVHPSQRPEEGWGDIPRLMRTLSEGNTSLCIIFEGPHWYPQALGDYSYRDGVVWIKDILQTLS